MKRYSCSLFIACLMTLTTTSSLASVVIQGTRVIYPESAKEVTVKMVNEGRSPLLVQSWLDDGNENGDPAKMKLPFIVTPPVSRLDPQKGQSVRITWTGKALAQDKESIFWFNVLEIPPKDKNAEGKSKLNLALRSRIKFFYRPASLKGSFIDGLNNVKWSLVNDAGNVAIVLKNDSPYYLSLIGGAGWAGAKKYDYKPKMLSPFSEERFVVPQLTTTSVNKVSWVALNDYGADAEVVKTVK